MKEIRDELFALADSEYAKFTANLIPNIPAENIIGVRAPALRALAASMGEVRRQSFLAALPHKYHEENMLHAYIICSMKEPVEILTALELFLPRVDNWAVCDCIRPKMLKKKPELLLGEIKKYLASEHEYTVRFGISMLMCYFLDELFQEEYPAIVTAVESERYYVNMMIAWYFATGLAKQWHIFIPYLENATLSPWIHRKTIQKAIESYRISSEQKAYLRSLRKDRR